MTSGHLVQECGEAIAAALDKAEAVELLYLAPAEKAVAQVELARLESRVAATRLRLMAVADEVARRPATGTSPCGATARSGWTAVRPAAT